jgi:proteinase-like protein with regulatory CLIP domain
MATGQMPGTEIKQPFPVGPPNRLARTYCRAAGHTGDWTYTDGRCVRIRRCKRCGDVTSKQEHTWSAFGYIAASQCEQERRCDRCGAIESRVLHVWGPWLYVGAYDARQFHICGRCGAGERTRYGGLCGW